MNYPAKLKNESFEIYTLFKHYFNLGENRNLDKLLAHTNRKINDLEDYKRIYNWDDRIQQFNLKNIKRTFSKKFEENIKANSKNVELLEKLHDNLFKCIDELQKISTPDKLFNEEDDNLSKINKIEKILKLINLFLNISEKIDKRISLYKLDEIENLEDKLSKIKIE